MIVVGVDPGNEGAIASTPWSHPPGPPRVWTMPTVKVKKGKSGSRTFLDEVRIIQFFERRRERIAHVFIEKVGGITGQSASAAFNFGAGWGFIKGVVATLRISFTLVSPQTWKKIMLKDMPKDKGSSVLVAKRLRPEVSLLPTPRSKKDSDGFADALCIAEYGRRILLGGS